MFVAFNTCCWQRSSWWRATTTFLSHLLAACAILAVFANPHHARASATDKTVAAKQENPPKTSSALDPLAQMAITSLPSDIRIFCNRGGLCLLLNASDETIALEIAQKTRCVVFALAKDDASCQKMRQKLDQAELYGTKATAMIGSLRKLPFPRGYGNLIIAGDYSEEMDIKEIMRVLNPHGLAIIGGGKTDSEKLNAALLASGNKNYKLNGHFAILAGQMPNGVDDWTHFTPRPDNINVSHEASLRPPFRTQWFLDAPTIRFSDSQMTVTHGLFLYRNANIIHAWDAFNGELLWDRKVARTKEVSRQALVDDTYYLIEKDAIIALDAVTGLQKKEYRLPSSSVTTSWTYTCDSVGLDGNGPHYMQNSIEWNGVFWQWLAVENGVVYGLAQIPNQDRCMANAGNLLCAFNLATGAILWQHTENAPIDSWSVALSSNSLCFCTFNKKSLSNGQLDYKGDGVAHACNIQTGEESWHTPVGTTVAPSAIGNPDSGITRGTYFTWHCYDEKGMREMKAFDVQNGKMTKEYTGFFSSSSGGIAVGPLFVDNRIFSNQHSKFSTNHPYNDYRALDVITGMEVPVGVDDLVKKQSCGPGCASANCLYSGGQNMSVSDLLTGKTWRQQYFRTSCATGPVIGNGMLFSVGGCCNCAYPISAPLALTAGGLDWTPPNAATDFSNRLIAGPAAQQTLSDEEKDAWFAYRGNAGHTGESTTQPTTPLTLAWSKKLGGRLTPVSCGANLVYVASREGSVWGLDQKTGEIRWHFLCGGGVRVTPVFSRGRVLFGSDDGWVYALDARTGALAWRFRVAPEDLYINADEQLSSIWPSSAGVLIESNVVYCAAGVFPFDGTYLYALDFQTGKPIWSQCIGDAVAEGAPQGIMALAEDAVIVPTFITGHNNAVQNKGGNQAYRKADGKKLDWYPDGVTGQYPPPLGSEAIADDNLFFYGGSGHGEAHAWGSAFFLMDAHTGRTVSTNRVDKTGIPNLTIAPNNVAPVLGKKLIVGDGVVYDRNAFCAAMKSTPGQVKDKLFWSFSPWGSLIHPKSPTSSIILAGNTVLVAGETEIVVMEAQPNGKELSRVKVPEKLLRNSLAVNHNRVFATSDSGSVFCLAGKE